MTGRTTDPRRLGRKNDGDVVSDESVARGRPRKALPKKKNYKFDFCLVHGDIGKHC